MKNIFIAFSPLNVLLCYCVALTYRAHEDNIFFIVSDFNESLKFSDAIRANKSSPFSAVYCLGGGYGRKGRLSNWLVRRKNILIIKDFIKKNQIKNAYSTNDMDGDGQAMLHFAKKKNKYVKGIFIEDGSAVYNDYIREKRPFWKILLAKIFYGWWWEGIKIVGTSSGVDSIMVRQPEFLRPELKNKEVIAIKKEDFIKLKEDIFFLNYIEKLGVKEEELNQIDVLLLFTYCGFFETEEYREKVLKKILKLAHDCKLRIAVKYHPRDNFEDFLSVKNVKDIIVLPRGLPLELFYLFASKSLKFVIGDVSTGLLTAKWLFSDNVRVISIAKMLNFQDSCLETFKKQKVELPNNFDSLFEKQ